MADYSADEGDELAIEVVLDGETVEIEIDSDEVNIEGARLRNREEGDEIDVEDDGR